MAYTNKKRPNTWNPASPTTKSVSIRRVKRWKSLQKKRTSRSSTASNARLTITTISTLTFSNKNSIHWQHSYHYHQRQEQMQQQDVRSVFHRQSLLFLFGFLFFPCWWIGGYCVKFTSNDVETSTIIIHPSMIANGKTSSKLFQLHRQQGDRFQNSCSLEEILFFYKWNRYMSIFSIFLFLLVISMLIWYFTLFS